MPDSWLDDRTCVCSPEVQAVVGTVTQGGVEFCAECRSCRHPADVKVPPPPGRGTQKPQALLDGGLPHQVVETPTQQSLEKRRNFIVGRPLWQYVVVGVLVLTIGGTAAFALRPKRTEYFDAAKAEVTMKTYPPGFLMDAERSCGYTAVCSCKVRTAMKWYTYQDLMNTANATTTEDLLASAAIQMAIEGVCNDAEGRKQAAE